MVKDKVPEYFDTLTRELDYEYGTDEVGYSQRRNDSPSLYPHMYFHQIGGAGIAPTLSGTQEGISIDIEIIAYHNKGTAKARQFADFIRKTMTDKMGFYCTMFTPSENISDDSIQMFVMRFNRTDTDKE